MTKLNKDGLVPGSSVSFDQILKMRAKPAPIEDQEEKAEPVKRGRPRKTGE